MLIANVMGRFCMSATLLSYLTELFNHRPQSKELEQTFLGACIFFPNVVSETLRLINLGFSQAHGALARG